MATGQKTETRRLKGLEFVNQSPDSWELVYIAGRDVKFKKIGADETYQLNSYYGQRGDTLWVREGWYVSVNYSGLKPREIPQRAYVQRGYTADKPRPSWAGKARPSIHMPRWLSRYTLQITSVTVERLHAITEDAARREGVEPMHFGVHKVWRDYMDDAHKNGGYKGFVETATGSFRSLWISINGQESWDANPWVWVISFILKKQSNV